MQTVRLAVRGESDLEGVLTYLQRIEENPLVMRVHELSLELAPPQQSDYAEQVWRAPQPRRLGSGAAPLPDAEAAPDAASVPVPGCVR